MADGFSFRIADAAAAHDARRLFIDRLRAEAGSSSDCTGAELIFGELLGNVKRHAPGPVDVVLRWNGDAAVLEMIDEGPGFDAARSTLPDQMSETSRGLFLVRSFGGADLRTYRDGQGRNVTHVVLPIQRAI